MSGLVSSREFADQLGVNRRRAQAIIEANHLASQRIGNILAVDTEDIRHYQRIRQRSAGQPLKPANAWQYAFFGFNPRSGPDELDEDRRRLRSRADHRPWHVHPSTIKRLRDATRRHVVIGGSDAAVALGVSVGGPHALLHVYTRARHVHELEDEARPELTSPSQANLIVHAVPDAAWPFHGEYHTALNVAWLDMADHNERGAEMVLREWKQR